jgi:hypothetical protein
MKYLGVLLMSVVLFQSCTDQETDASPEQTDTQIETQSNVIDEQLANRWVYKERVNAEGTKRLEFGDESSQRIIRLESNGHFMIYDSITDERIIEKGVPRIAKKSSGQWETEGMKLVLRHIENDTIRIEELLIERLESGELVTATENRGRVTYFSLD